MDLGLAAALPGSVADPWVWGDGDGADLPGSS